MKICNTCNKKKHPREYTKDKRNKDGLQGCCNVCKNLKRSIRYSSDINYRKKVKESQKKYSEKARERANKHVQELSDFYIIASLKRHTDLTTEDIKKHPNLIALKKQVLKNKRLCRKSKI